MKIFKNVRAYRFTGPVPASDDVAAAVDQQAFSDASGSMATEWAGFVPVLGDKGLLVSMALKIQGWTFITLQIESRIIPSGAVKDATEKKVKQIEEREQRKVYAKEKKGLKEEVLQAMIPRAFTRKKRIQAVIDHENGMLYVDAFSSSDASYLLSKLREGLGSLPVQPVLAKMPLCVTAGLWIKGGEAPQRLAFGERCKLVGPSSERVQYTNFPLGTEEVQAHLAAGLQPAAIELTLHNGEVTLANFILNEDLSLQRFQLDAELLNANEHESETPEDQALADATLMMHTLQECMQVITQALGGEEMPEAAESA